MKLVEFSNQAYKMHFVSARLSAIDAENERILKQKVKGFSNKSGGACLHW